MYDFIKIADSGMEEAGITDPRTGLPIRISITTRKKYRKYWGGQEMGGGNYSRMNWGSLRNKDLNEIIAGDFSSSHDKLIHIFKSNRKSESGGDEWIELRMASSHGVGPKLPFNVFLAVLRRQSIDIITVTTGYRKPNSPRLVIPEIG